jgi:hypothetical protein
MTLQNILCLALEKLGYHWYKSGTACTREGPYRTSIEVQYILSPATKPMFTIYGKALPYRCERKDSALIRALIFIDDSLGYKIGDVNFI